MIRTCIALTAAAALLGVAAPAQADNTQLLAVVMKWTAVVGKDAAALGPAANKGPAQADVAALKLKRDSHAAANAADAVNASSAVGAQVRDQFASRRDRSCIWRSLRPTTTTQRARMPTPPRR